jgi:hypothetical protein
MSNMCHLFIFGHLILAHSFVDGKACKTPSGPRAGTYTMELTNAGMRAFSNTNINKNKPLSLASLDLFVTHSDMVEQLPETAVSLGGGSSPEVPIQAAAYFETPQQAASFASDNNDSSTTTRPFAISFQAHPEYATTLDRGLKSTLYGCMNAMEQKHLITSIHHDKALQDAHDTFLQVQNDSISAMVATGRLLGWFPW